MRSVLTLGMLLVFAGGAHAQQTVPSPDFFFGRPDGALTVRGAWVFARASSDLFDFVERELTIDEGTFDRAALAVDYGIAATSRTDVVVGLEVNRASVQSEYRNLVDNNRLPIEQTTSLMELNLSGSVRFALAPRGREISRLAWVPGAVVPYVGAGAGMLWYQFRQHGDFVDALDPRLPVFPAAFEAEGWTPSVQLLGGIDVRLHHRWFLNFDGRYLWAAGPLSDDLWSERI